MKATESPSAASVYSKLFSGPGRAEVDPFKRKKTKVRKGKAFKKEIKKKRKIRKIKRIVGARLKNEGVLLSNLKDKFPGIVNVEENARNVDVVYDPTGRTFDREKVDKILAKLLTKKEEAMNGLIAPKKKKLKGKDEVVNNDLEKKISKKRKEPKSSEENADTSSTKNKISKVNVKAVSSSGKSNGISRTIMTNETSDVSSETSGRKQLQWILGDTSMDKFFRDNWEKSPLYVPRKQKSYYKCLVTSELIDLILRNNFIEYTKNIDITSYTDGKRETHNPEGRALPHVVWDYYQDGCSVRFLNPQSYIPALQNLNASLQELFGCFVGANTYLTPCNSQGFAPHYDDIEAFILQLEGRKHWKVYAPRNNKEELPRFSSPNFSQEEIGSPILEVILEAGDLLYIPRGFIHQASTVNSEHSLHVTISVYQKTAWIDLLEKVLPHALATAASSSVDFRRGLPLGYLKHAGLARGKAGPERKKLKETLKSLVTRIVDYVDVDAGVDAMGRQFMHDALPPLLTQDEKKCTVFEGGLKMSGTKITNEIELNQNTKLKLVRANVCRLVEELSEETHQLEVRIYYSLDNSLEYHGKEPQYLIVPEEARRVVTKLFKSYPKFCSIEQLVNGNSENETECFQVLQDLWEHGILMTPEPL